MTHSSHHHRPVVLNHDVEAQLGSGDHMPEPQADGTVPAPTQASREHDPHPSAYHREQELMGMLEHQS